MDEDKMRVGNIRQVGRDVIIAGRDVIKGYTPEEVAALLAEISSTFQPKPFDGRCPYKGLAVFEEEDAGLFFGRERLVENLAGRVRACQTVFITGPSGSGKSSLVRAGLIPALKQGAIEGSERWLYETMRPGRDPLTELARVASGYAGTLSAGEDIRTKGGSDATILSQWCEIALKDNRARRAVLFIDQFEELFTQVAREEQRAAFLDLVLHAATIENGRMIVLFAMRSDFVSNCAAYPQLNALLNQQFVQIGAMQPDELVSAIAQPALRVGLRVDPALISQIIADMQGEPGALPLMQFVLRDLFDAEQAGGGLIALKLTDYLERGGIRKALERHADAEFQKLTKSERSLTENLFKGLVEIGDNTPATRRIARFNEFASSAETLAALDSVVARLADARLISTDENEATGRTITLAHEKLIEAWPWLQQLVRENRESIRLQNQILEDAIEWEKHGKDKSYLYSGTRLTSVQKKFQDSQISNEKARLFLAASRKAHYRNLFQFSVIALLLLTAVYFMAIRPLFESEINLQPVELGGAGVNALQAMPDGTIYAGMFNNQLKKTGGPCLARLPSSSQEWQMFGPTCTKTVVALWVDPQDPQQIFFSHSVEPGLYRSQDGGQTWDRLGKENGLPLENISSLVGAEDGTLFAADYLSNLGVYTSTDQGQTWSPLSGSPAEVIYMLSWQPSEGLLVGGNGGLWLWKPGGEWRQLITLDVTKKDQSIYSAVVVPAQELTILASGEEGIYLWKDGDPASNTVRDDTVKMAYSLALVNKPEPYVIALTFPNSKIWRMTIEGAEPHVMKDVGAEGLPLIAQEQDELRLWVGTLDRLYMGSLRTKITEMYRSK